MPDRTPLDQSLKNSAESMADMARAASRPSMTLVRPLPSGWGMRRQRLAIERTNFQAGRRSSGSRRRPRNG